MSRVEGEFMHVPIGTIRGACAILWNPHEPPRTAAGILKIQEPIGGPCESHKANLIKMQVDAKAYVKRFTSVPETFIDELFQMMSESTKQSDIVIDVDKVAKWLNMLKNNIVKTLKRSYIQDVDYTLTREANPIKRKYGSNNWITVRVSPACFKELAMRSNSKNSALIRTYMLQVEDAFISYRNQTLEGMRNDVKVLLNNQKPRETRTNSKPGYVYMFRAKDGVHLV